MVIIGINLLRYLSGILILIQIKTMEKQVNPNSLSKSQRHRARKLFLSNNIYKRMQLSRINLWDCEITLSALTEAAIEFYLDAQQIAVKKNSTEDRVIQNAINELIEKEFF